MNFSTGPSQVVANDNKKFSNSRFVGECKTGGKSLTGTRALGHSQANKDRPVLQECPGYDIKLHPLRELWLGDRMLLPLTVIELRSTFARSGATC